jgi:hypothetical protein
MFLCSDFFKKNEISNLALLFTLIQNFLISSFIKADNTPYNQFDLIRVRPRGSESII